MRDKMKTVRELSVCPRGTDNHTAWARNAAHGTVQRIWGMQQLALASVSPVRGGAPGFYAGARPRPVHAFAIGGSTEGLPS